MGGLIKAEQESLKQVTSEKAENSETKAINQPEASPEKIGKNIIGQPFPEITSKSLADNVVTFPEAMRGKVTLICIAFVRSAQDMIDSWIQPFEREFGKDSRFAVYEIPMINKAWKVLSWMIDSGMRGGIPAEKHDNVVTFYGDYSGYQKTLGMEDTNLAYVFLLYPKGIIAGKGRGMRNLKLKENFLRLQKLSYES
ncbi:MAG TPA: hypothetical protein VFM18_13040 [Methanosarcina sp.]|nr:hypothetical protein [Methanosarcina sp.]